MARCEYCGDYFESTVEVNGYNLCENCVKEKKYVFCENCGKLINPNSPSNAYINGCYYCTDCYTICERCDHIIPVSQAFYTHYDAVCEDCYMENYFCCCDCGGIYDIGDCVSVNGDGYCEDCLDDALENMGIHSYYYKPTPNFLELENESHLRKNNLHIGIELEIQSMANLKSFSVAMSEKYDFDDGIFYLKRDGSLNEYGVEIVSHPMSLNFIQNSGDWEYCFNQMKKYEMKDIDNCGLHFHLDKQYLNNNMISTIDYIVNNFSDFFALIGGRDYIYYCKKVNKSTNEWGIDNGDRFSAVNLRNTNTVELRFCESTCDYDTFVKRVKMVFAIVQFAKQYKIKDICDWNSFEFVENFQKIHKDMFDEFAD